MEFNLEDIRTLLGQIEWQRYREGTYLNTDPLLVVREKLRDMRLSIKADDKSNGSLNAPELGLLLQATLGSIDYVNAYNYGFSPDENARLRESTLSPLLAIAAKLRSATEWNEVIIPNTLTQSELEELEGYESVIDRGLATFIEVGNALAVIRDKRLYRAEHKTFEGYCQKRWGLSRTYAHRMIEASQAACNLLPIGNILPTMSKENDFPLPACESQARPLTHLDPEQQRQVWQQAVETAPDGKITAAHVQRTVELAISKMPPHISYNAGDNEWYTPPEFIKAARDVMGNIDLDPASTPKANEIVQANKFYTKEDDGLSKDWTGKVWMNPPYASGLIDKFVDKLVGYAKSGQVTEAIVLVNNATETLWFSELVSIASAICFPLGRVRFWAPNKVSQPLQGQAIIYIGSEIDKFLLRFKEFGWVAQVFKSTNKDGRSRIS